MRFLLAAMLVGAIGIPTSGMVSTPAKAAKYSVVCVAPGAPRCRTACSSNTHTVVCYASVQNGRCVKYCGRPR
jgi:hypothetical protein